MQPQTQTQNAHIQKETLLTEADAVCQEQEEKHDEGQHDQGRRSRCCLQRGASDVGRVHPYLGKGCAKKGGLMKTVRLMPRLPNLYHASCPSTIAQECSTPYQSSG